jgi:hypothetical protein
MANPALENMFAGARTDSREQLTFWSSYFDKHGESEFLVTNNELSLEGKLSLKTVFKETGGKIVLVF